MKMPRAMNLVWALAMAFLFSGALCAETVLVVPFVNRTAAPNLDWIGESISESLRDSLVSQGVLVLDREARLEGYRRVSLRPGADLTHASLIKLGQALDASVVVYGEYLQQPPEDPKGQSKGSIHITGRVLDLGRTRLGPALTQSGPIEELPTMQLQMAWTVFRQIDPRATIEQTEFLRLRPTLRLDAMENYVRGLLAATAEQRHRFFTQAARIDGKFSQPCLRLAQEAWAQKDYKVAASWFLRVDHSNPDYFQALFFLGLCRYYGGDSAGAIDAFEHVAQAVPLNEVYNDLGAAQLRRNDLQAAVASFRKAIDGDEADPDYQFNLGYALWRMKDFEGAVTSFRAAVERDSTDAQATTLLGRALKEEGPRPGDPLSEGRQRIKTNYDEFAYRQLQAELTGKKN